MDLVLATSHYPFKGETFLEAEVKIAQDFFDRIIILTAETNNSQSCYYIPKNARIVCYREHMNMLERALRVLPVFISLRFWRELVYAKKTTKYSLSSIVLQILIDESEISYLKRSEKLWKGKIDPKNTIFYSYWLSGAATYISRLDNDCFLRVSRAHGGDCFFNRGYHPYRREQLCKLDAIFPISEAGRNDLLEHYSAECRGVGEKIRTARLGIKIYDGMHNPWKKQEVKTIVTCSNVIPLKRLDLMIAALSEIEEMQIKWIHFGDGSEMASIKKMACEKLSDRGNISYQFEGYVQNDIIMGFYEEESVDLFVNCSDVEGIPVSMMEAMAYGIPAIGRNIGGISELIDDNCGKLLDAKTSAEQLADAIVVQLSKNEADMKKLRENAGKRVRTRYSAADNYGYLFKIQMGLK
ncbi:MAG: glycosyltransferase [Clostridiales bacterium]|nr:glycosyltransferase [Clostridiales bacterium]